MTDISILNKVLPISSLDPECLALIDGFAIGPYSQYDKPLIWLYEPRAGQHEPFVDPVKAMALLFRYQGMEADAVVVEASSAYAELRPRLCVTQRVHGFRPVRAFRGVGREARAS